MSTKIVYSIRISAELRKMMEEMKEINWQSEIRNLVEEYVKNRTKVKFIAEARKIYPDSRFVVCDYITDPIIEKFDVILASGVLNSNVPDNMEFRKKAIKVMFDHTKKVLAFNMLGAHPQPKNDRPKNVWYADSLEILKYCMSLTRRVILRANYHPTDFSIFMYPTRS